MAAGLSTALAQLCPLQGPMGHGGRVMGTVGGLHMSEHQLLHAFPHCCLLSPGTWGMCGQRSWRTCGGAALTCLPQRKVVFGVIQAQDRVLVGGRRPTLGRGALVQGAVLRFPGEKAETGLSPPRAPPSSHQADAVHAGPCSLLDTLILSPGAGRKQQPTRQPGLAPCPPCAWRWVGGPWPHYCTCPGGHASPGGSRRAPSSQSIVGSPGISFQIASSANCHGTAGASPTLPEYT